MTFDRRIEELALAYIITPEFPLSDLDVRQIGVKCELYRLVSLCGKTLRSPLASPCNLKLSVLVEERGEDINSTLVAEAASVSNLYLLHQVNDKVITKFPGENETFLSALCNFV